MLHPNSQAATHGADKDREKGDAPSGRSAASFLPRDNSILGSSSATHSTRHVASVTFWNVDMAIPKGKVPPLRWETSFVAGLWRRAQDVVPPSSLLTRSGSDPGVWGARFPAAWRSNSASVHEAAQQADYDSTSPIVVVLQNYECS